MDYRKRWQTESSRPGFDFRVLQSELVARLRDESATAGAPDCAAGIVIGMIAHELAHAYLHRGLAGHPHRLELEADWIAGWVLGRAGICPAHFVRVLRELAATAAHPSLGYREDVVSRGYARGSAVRAVG